MEYNNLFITKKTCFKPRKNEKKNIKVISCKLLLDIHSVYTNTNKINENEKNKFKSYLISRLY